MNIVGSLVGIHGLEVHEVSHHMIFLADAVAAVHIPGEANHGKGLAARVSLDQGNVLWRAGSFVEHPPHPQAGLEA